MIIKTSLYDYSYSFFYKGERGETGWTIKTSNSMSCFSFGTNLVTVANTNRCLLLHLYISTSREKQNQAFFWSGRLITQYKFCLSFRLAKVTFPTISNNQKIKKNFQWGAPPPPTPPPPSTPNSGEWAHAYTSKRRNFLISSRALRAREHFSN